MKISRIFTTTDFKCFFILPYIEINCKHFYKNSLPLLQIIFVRSIFLTNPSVSDSFRNASKNRFGLKFICVPAGNRILITSLSTSAVLETTSTFDFISTVVTPFLLSFSLQVSYSCSKIYPIQTTDFLRHLQYEYYTLPKLFQYAF